MYDLRFFGYFSNLYHFKKTLYFSVVRPVLIISIALSGVYLMFSILLLKGIKEVRSETQKSLLLIIFKNKFSQNSRHKVWPWLVWSIIYVLIGVSCGIYELCLGGTVLEVTLVPIAYLAIFSLWSYAIWSVFDYFKSMEVSATADTVSPDGEFYSKPLFLTNIYLKKIS
jgi:hypothetical protein